MDFNKIARILGIVAFFTGTMMFLAMPWGFERFGGDWSVEKRGVTGLALSILVSFIVGFLLLRVGKEKFTKLLRKESLAAVSFSWLLVIFLSALPYLFSCTYRGPGEQMRIADALFESASGVTTTGATVISELEDPNLVPRTILFWRSETLFMGGLGIMVFFVALLGNGTLGRQIMAVEKGNSASSEYVGTSSEFAHSLAGIYIGMIIILTILLRLCGVDFYNALCHAFSTLATGGFSTYNAGIGHFAAETDLNAFLIEMILVVFMILGGTNFVLFYCFFVKGKRFEIFKDTEWRVYIGIILTAALIIFVTGLFHSDFDASGTSDQQIRSLADGAIPWYHGLRQSIFHVASIITGTGFATDEYEKWNAVSLLVLLAVMFIGGCVGGAAGGVKVSRVIVAVKTIKQTAEKTCRPNMVRPINIGSVTISDSQQRWTLAFLFVFSFSVVAVSMVVLAIEGSVQLWGDAAMNPSTQLTDVFSSTLAMFSNVGPAFGFAGARQNYGDLTAVTKVIYSFSMFLGRLEIFIPLLICTRLFWRR